MRLWCLVTTSLLAAACTGEVDSSATGYGGGTAGAAGGGSAGGQAGGATAGGSATAGGGATGGGTASGGGGGAEPPAPKCRIATGRYHTVLLKDDGTVWNWGRDIGNTPVQVTALGSDNLQVEGGLGESCALKSDGSIWCWVNAGTPTLKFAGPAVRFALGFGHACAIGTDRALWCWGANEHGQVGHGQQTLSSSGMPVGQVTELGNQVAQVTAGNQSTCALKTDGTVWCWGQNGSGWLGNGTASPYEQRPVQVTALGPNADQVSGENQGSCALKKDKTVWCWWGAPDERNGGSNAGPIAVNADELPASTPVAVAGLTSIAQLSIGMRVASALKSDGTLWTWGPVYALGRTTPSGPVAAQVTALGRPVTQVSNRYRHSCARTDDGLLWCWGSTSHGALGNGQDNGVELPVRVNTTCQ